MSDPLVEQLAHARWTGEEIASPPELAVDDGYRTAATLQSRLGEPAGWKVGATNPAGQAFLRVSEPIRGRVFKHGMLQSPALLDAPGSRPCEVEPEVIFELGEGGAIVRAFIGMEVNRPSRDDAMTRGAGFIVADNAAHVALVLGPEIGLEQLDAPASIRAVISSNAGATNEGDATAVLGDPRLAVAWLATKVILRPGEFVATGAMSRSVALPRGGRIIANFGVLGEVVIEWPPQDARLEVMGGDHE